MPQRTQKLPYWLTQSRRKRAARAQIFREQSGLCVYCRQPMKTSVAQDDPSKATFEHLHPLDRGGRSDKGNVVLACRHCNEAKGNLMPLEFIVFGAYPGRSAG